MNNIIGSIQRASVLSIQTDTPADENQESPKISFTISPPSFLIAPNLERASPIYRTFESLSSPLNSELQIRKFAKTAASANGVYIVKSPSSTSSKSTGSPLSITESSSNSPDPTDDSSQSTDEGNEFIFKPIDEGIDFRIEGAKPKHGIESADQPMMETVARILSPSDIVPPTAFLTINFDSFDTKEVVESKEDDSDEEIEIVEFKSDTFPLEEISQSSQLKTGSAQKFIKGTQSFEKMTPRERDRRIQKISKDEVDDLSILDIRAYNTDRHLGNVLIDQENHIHAIDHGCIATRGFKDPALFCWMEWPQAHKPYSKEKKKEILSLNWENTEKQILDAFPKFPKASLETLRLSHFLLQEGVKRNLTPFQIGCLLAGHKQTAGITYPGILQMLYEKKMTKGIDPHISSFEEDFKKTVTSLLHSLKKNMKLLKNQATTEKKPLSKVIYDFLKGKI